jgi:AraC family transcriptional regulator
MACTPESGAKKHKRARETRFSVTARWIAHGETAEIANLFDQKGVTAILGGGRGCQLLASKAASAIWIPLRGRLQIGNGGDSLLGAGEVRVTEDVSVQAIGRGNSLWIVLFGRPAAWRQLMLGRIGASLAEAWLFPAKYAADRDLRRRAVALARAIAAGSGVEIAVENILERVVAMQSGFSEAIARCPGRTYAQQRQVFVRLQRVRNYLLANCRVDVENEALARMANYSPSHFIRAFRAVYEETPHSFLIRQRLDLARRLLSSSPLAINEIAIEAGFDNPSAFSRVFRQRFGITAGTARRQMATREAFAG